MLYNLIKFKCIKINDIYYFYSKNFIFCAPSLIQGLIFKKYLNDVNEVKKSEAFTSFLFSLFESSIGHNNIILDIGANIGYTANYYEKLLKKYNYEDKTSILAFEPMPLNHGILSFNLRKSSIIYCLPIGLSSTNKVVNFSIPKSYLDQNSKYKNNTGLVSGINNGENGIKRYVDFADNWEKFINQNHSRVCFIKVDIEGMEDQFFSGAKNIIRKHKPTIKLELNWNYFNLENATHWLSKLCTNGSYTIFFTDQKNELSNKIFKLKDLKLKIKKEAINLYLIPKKQIKNIELVSNKYSLAKIIL